MQSTKQTFCTTQKITFYTYKITFPRDATRSCDLPCCAAASWSCAKYGLPALSTVFPSAGVSRRQRGQTCVPTN